MCNPPVIRTRIKTVFEVTDELGRFEIIANHASDREVVEGLVSLITAAQCHDEWQPLRDHANYAVYELVSTYFALDRAKDGLGDRFTRALFSGSFHL